MKTRNILMSAAVSFVLCGVALAESQPDRFYQQRLLPSDGWAGVVLVHVGHVALCPTYMITE